MGKDWNCRSLGGVTKVESEEFLSLFLFPVSPLILDAPPSISETKLGSAPKIYNALNRDQLSDHEWVIPDGSEKLTGGYLCNYHSAEGIEVPY